MSCVPQNEMVVLADDVYGHVGSSNVGYDRMHGGYVATNADGFRILDFTESLVSDSSTAQSKSLMSVQRSVQSCHTVSQSDSTN